MAPFLHVEITTLRIYTHSSLTSDFNFKNLRTHLEQINKAHSTQQIAG